MASINQYRARFLAGIDLSAKLKWLPALSSKPWLHFLLLGGCYSSCNGGGRIRSYRWLSCLSSKSTACVLRIQLSVKWQQMLAEEVDREILFREALARQLHFNDSVIRSWLILDMQFLEPDNISGVEQLLAEAVAMDLQYNDPIVRQRLLELMKLALSAEGQAKDPEEDVLRSRYNLQRAQFVGLARSHFQHVFISRDRREDAEGKAAELLSHLLALDEPEQSAPLSDPFLHGRFFHSAR
jgi:hypothetical protein